MHPDPEIWVHFFVVEMLELAQFIFAILKSVVLATVSGIVFGKGLHIVEHVADQFAIALFHGLHIAKEGAVVDSRLAIVLFQIHGDNLGKKLGILFAIIGKGLIIAIRFDGEAQTGRSFVLLGADGLRFQGIQIIG